MSNQVEWDKTFMRIAYEFAKHSTCIRKHVGAIITKDNRIITTGYNGTPSGIQHCNEVFKNINMKEMQTIGSPLNLEHGKFSRNFELHAEQNAIAFAAKYEIVLDSPKVCLYTTLSPCVDCAKLIVASGVKRVVYDEDYDRGTEGIDLLNGMGIEVVSLHSEIKKELKIE